MTVLTWTLPSGVSSESVEDLDGNEVDHTAIALARLPQQFRDKTNIEALIRALVGPATAIETALLALLAERSVTVAVGDQLTVLGDIVGQGRAGLDDDDYRRYIRARIATNKSNGLVSDLIKVARLVLDDDDAVLVVDQQGVAAVVVRVLEAVLDVAVRDILITFMRQTKSAGVRMLVETLTELEAASFAFDHYAWNAITLLGANGETAILVAVPPAVDGVGIETSFPASGTIVIGEGLGTEETLIYESIVRGEFYDEFRLTTEVANLHDAGEEIRLVAHVGESLGDSTDPLVGGALANVA